jgi:hypothetical protein
MSGSAEEAGPRGGRAKWLVEGRRQRDVLWRRALPTATLWA